MENITSMNSQVEIANPNEAISIIHFLHPSITIFGIIMNTWTTLTLISGKVKISPTTRIYYLLISIADLNIVVCNFFIIVTCESVAGLTNGRAYFCPNIMSLFTCIIILLWIILAEFVSNYALVALSIVRLIAFYWPLRAKVILTKKFTYYLLFIILGPVSLYTTILISFGAVIDPTPGPISQTSCFIDNNRIFGYLFNLSYPVIYLGIHTIVDLIVSLMLFFKVYTHKQPDLNKHSKKSSKELSATLTLIFLCIITLIVYGTSLVAFVATLIFQYFVAVPIELSTLIFQIFIRFVAASTVPHSLNIFVYFALIPTFRQVALCGLCKAKLETSTRSALTQ